LKVSKAYTRTGDKGETGLYDGGRVSKHSLRVEAYGEVDELNSQIGLARTQIKDEDLTEALLKVQKDLFVVGGELATHHAESKIPHISNIDLEMIEAITDRLNDKLEPLRRFILPGGSIAASQLQVARTVCRRAERRVVALSKVEPVSQFILQYMNRLSSLLFVMARTANVSENVPEQEWIHV
jgi:cob(I)alamin adenosyltransferase